MKANVTIDEQEYVNLTVAKDNAYWERNQLVAALSKIFSSHLAKHPSEDKNWDPAWRTIVVIYLPARYSSDFVKAYEKGDEGPVTDYQMTWHIHDHDVAMFDHLRYNSIPGDWYGWDEHTTEEKYRRLRTLLPKLGVK